MAISARIIANYGHMGSCKRPFLWTYTLLNQHPFKMYRSSRQHRLFSSHKENLTEHLHPYPIQTIQRPQCQHASDVVVIDVKYVGSYSWLKTKVGILVPSSPKKWVNKPTPIHVEDLPPAGKYSEPTEFLSSKSSLLPLIVAVEANAKMKGEAIVNWPDIDFVVERNQLLKLMNWISGGKPSEFRFNVQLAGTKTILLSQGRKRPRKTASGLAKDFVRASTEEPYSDGHFRIITYNMGGLNMMVRSTADAYLPDPERSPASTSNVEDSSDSSAATTALPTRSSDFHRFERAKKKFVLEGSLGEIPVLRGGLYVPQSSTVYGTPYAEDSLKRFDWKSKYPKLFFSQTQHHFIAAHDKTKITEIIHHTLDSPEYKAAARETQPDLRKLVRALRVIQELAMEHGRRGLSLVHRDGELKLYKRRGYDDRLPDDVLKLFD